MKKTAISIIFILFVFFPACQSDKTVAQSTTQPTPTPEVTYTDTQLLDMAESESFKYFWDYAEVHSKLARERYHTDNPGNDAYLVTTGGSGFGLMNIIVGVSRGYVTRVEATDRLQIALNYLANANRFHGAWPHWMDGNTGNVVPFGTVDNGGDLVETSFLCQGLICVREYFKNGNTQEQAIANQADVLWKGVDWDWYRDGRNVLLWHWSPDYNFQMNFELRGYNEALITYVLAAASPTHPILPIAYQQGWANNGGITSSATKYNIPVIVNHNGANGSVGPLFWAHYSYLGLDPRGLSDSYVTNYWNLVRNHALINLQHSILNPNNYAGYSAKCWGLTASYSRNSDGSTGYFAHDVNHDKGVISPTAAISSIPYTPLESINFLRYLYQEKKNLTIGICGPYDAFSIATNWSTPRYLAIDQGTIVPMIENYRTGLLWNLFMNAPEVKQGLINLGFHSTQYNF
jgi:hypothetical protein